MLGGCLTTRRRCATSVCSCSGTQAPGQRRWRVGTRELQQIRSYTSSDRSRTGLTRPRWSGCSRNQRSVQPLRCSRPRSGRSATPSPASPDRLFITAGCCCLLLVSPAPSLKRDASLDTVLDTHGRTRRDPLTGQGASFRPSQISARPLHHFLLSANLLRFLR